MSEMVKRVAEAMQRAYQETGCLNWEAEARAAIAAMREPTEAMRCAAVARGGAAYSDDGLGGAGVTWWAMIEAALL